MITRRNLLSSLLGLPFIGFAFRKNKVVDNTPPAGYKEMAGMSLQSRWDKPKGGTAFIERTYTVCPEGEVQPWHMWTKARYEIIRYVKYDASTKTESWVEVLEDRLKLEPDIFIRRFMC